MVATPFTLPVKVRLLSKEIFLLNLLQVAPAHSCSQCLGLVSPTLALLQTDPLLQLSHLCQWQVQTKCPVAEPTLYVGLGWRGSGSRLLLLFIRMGEGPCAGETFCGSGDLEEAALRAWVEI